MDKTTAAQNPLLRLIDKHPYPNHDGNANLYRKIHERMNISRFTPLQEKAFSDDCFWNTEKSLMIRGATSSGKTLIAEIAMAQCRQAQKQVIYLAPLRAMVSQKYADFKLDFSCNSVERVVASSRDFQAQDETITQGYYTTAVMVYEKFYALISQNESSRMLESCGLIILDEIQMIGEQERGMKIIMSLIKAIQLCPDVRIIGLSTTYCDVTEILNWFHTHLKKDLYLIENKLNSLPLEEIVIQYDGRFRGKYIHSREDEESGDLLRLQQEAAQRLQTDVDDTEQLSLLPGIGLPPERRIARMEEQKKNLLQRVVALHPGRKIIIFCHSRNYCRSLAQLLATSTKKPLADETKRRLDNEIQSDVRDELRDSLLPCGVAYHHGALSHSMRSIIEDAFKDTEPSDGRARLDILVATETLAIGVNLPADIIIVYDTLKHDRDGNSVPIDEQTYKNYIGRAGRLMRRIDEDFRPRSYLLALRPDDMKTYWTRYINAKETTIVPVFRCLSELDALPYFLSLVSLSNGSTTQQPENIRELLNKNIPGVKGVDTFVQLLTNSGQSASSQIERDWKAAELTRNLQKQQRGYADMPRGLALSNFGTSIVPFALSIETCATIRYYFVNEVSEGLPSDITREELDQNTYLADILYFVCYMPEIRDKFRNIEIASYNRNPTEYYKQRDSIFTFFRDILPKSGGSVFWRNSILQRDVSIDDYMEDTVFLNVLLRIAVLLHWTGGGALNEFKEKTNIPFPLEEGDVERLADVASYLLEAIGKTIKANSKLLPLQSSLVRLSNRVKYGCDDACVRILNCHIPGIPRQSMLRAEQRLNEIQYGQTLHHFIMHNDDEMNMLFTKGQINSIRDGLRAKYGEDLVSSLSNVKREDLLPEGLKELILRAPRDSDTLVKFFNLISEQPSCPFLFRQESDRPAVYSATYFSFRLYFLFFPEQNGGQVESDYNERSFLIDYEAFLCNHPGHYYLVSEQKFNWDNLNQHINNCTLCGITASQLFNLYLSSLPEMISGFNPFLYTLHHNTAGIIPTETASLPDKGYWSPSGAPQVFISYVHRSSQNYAQQLYDLFPAGTAFLDSIGILKGASFPSVLREAILSCHTYLLLFDDYYGTDDSMWTKQEIDAIVNCRNSQPGNRQILPILLTNEGAQTFLRQYPDINSCNCINGMTMTLPQLLEEVRRSVKINEQ